MTLIIARKESDGIRLYADRVTMMGHFKLAGDTKKIATIDSSLAIGISGECAVCDRLDIYIRKNYGRLRDDLSIQELMFECADHIDIKMKKDDSPFSFILVYKGVIYHGDSLGSINPIDEGCAGLAANYACAILKYNKLKNQETDMQILFKSVNELVPTISAEFDTVFLPL